MSNVVDLSVDTVIDRPAEYALRQAAEAGLASAVVMGWDENGMFYFVSSMPDAAKVFLLCDIAKAKLMQRIIG